MADPFDQPLAWLSARQRRCVSLAIQTAGRALAGHSGNTLWSKTFRVRSWRFPVQLLALPPAEATLRMLLEAAPDAISAASARRSR